MIGDQTDFITRIKSILPRWFSNDSNPLLEAMIAGLANGLAFAYSQYSYSVLQTRIKTATDGWLDLIAWDFFGAKLQRKAGQSDTSYRNRILINLFRERGTRNAIVKVLQDLTGRTPLIFEFRKPIETGAWSQSVNGYGLAGAYGSMVHPFQCFVTALRPSTSGIPYASGYGINAGGYSVASRLEYADMSMIDGSVTDADIYEAIDSVTMCGTTAWTNITN